MKLTKFGLWIARSIAEEQYGEAAKLAEDLGYGALWLGGSPRLPKLRLMLEASEQIVIATGIVNIWAYDPAELAEEFAVLDADFPGRILLGIGIGHPEATQEYEKPLSKTQGFLDGIAASEHPVARERMALAALGPKMLDLSYERTLGTHPYFTPPAHTSFARERLGTAALVAPELAAVIDNGDSDAAYEVARSYASMYLGLSNYTNNLKRFGYTDEAIANGGTRELIDEIVPQGSPVQVAAAVHSHLDAGADHVCVQTLQPKGATGVPTDDWRALAEVLID
jgi:probable F420-dependent oxidoreductase